ncbi:hypothetical protein HGRIS_012623 [Hohenbuehelia grisea]
MPALVGWHRGERAIQEKLNYQAVMAMGFTWIEGDMPEQHREFYASRLPFLPVTTLDAQGRPWGSILAGRDGKPGFIRSPSYKTLTLDVRTWEGDPFWENTRARFGSAGEQLKPALVAGIGVEFSTRRRNKFAGSITRLLADGQDLQLEFDVNQAIGNCPKYINVRDLVPHPSAPKVLYRHHSLNDSDRLPDEVIEFILNSDTTFVGTTYAASKEEEAHFPSHVGMNQRGGHQGFVRVVPSDGRTVVLPDYSGNRLMTSLGNIEATPLASLTFVSFTTGAVLYITGDAQNLVGPEAQKIMPLHNALTTVRTTGYVFVEDALPVRQQPGTVTQPSPYSPPIRLLAEEGPKATYLSGDHISATLAKVNILSPSLATFTWETSRSLDIKPGQAIIMDFTPFLGEEAYQHMSPQKPTSVNDDRIRTWTVSSAHTDGPTRSFDLTMREKPGGAVTGALFSIARKLLQVRPELLANMRPLEMRVNVIGVSGDLTLPDAPSKDEEGGSARVLWVAGGIGVTPFLSMLAALRVSAQANPVNVGWDIAFMLVTREPEVILPLIETAIAENPGGLNVTLDVFSNRDIPDINIRGVNLKKHQGRPNQQFILLSDVRSDLEGRKVFLCGPPGLEKDMIAALGDIGTAQVDIRREGFGY